MLIFKREEFKAGMMVIKDRKKNAKGDWVEVLVGLKPKHKNTKIKFNDEDHVLEKYPQFFVKE